MTSVYIQTAKQVFEIEANALNALSERLDSDFDDAVKTILDAKGKVIICGMGKSGIIGKKIAATLASTGTPSFFMHPGDLGMVTSDDVFVAISNSGETDEVVKLIPFLKDNNNYLVALTGNAKSTLATAANAHLDVGVAEEACPLQLAPTSSTTATLAMGDALAVTLMKARDFKPENFARFHPGGSLGRRLLSRVEDEMVSTDLPFVTVNSSLLDVIQTMSVGRLGLAIIKDVDGYAMITDGDVRRLIEQYKEAAFSKVASDFMSLNPAQVPLGTRVEDALALVDSRKISSLLVVDKDAIVGVFKK